MDGMQPCSPARILKRADALVMTDFERAKLLDDFRNMLVVSEPYTTAVNHVPTDERNSQSCTSHQVTCSSDEWSPFACVGDTSVHSGTAGAIAAWQSAGQQGDLVFAKINHAHPCKRLRRTDSEWLY